MPDAGTIRLCGVRVATVQESMKSRGHAVFCTKLYIRTKALALKYRYASVLGILEAGACYPEWLNKKLEKSKKLRKNRTRRSNADGTDNEIRFIDSHYNELFRIKDGESITVKFSDGSMSDRKCTYIDDYHTKIGYNVFHICEFAELMERGKTTYRPKDIPGYTLEKIEQSEFEYTFAPTDRRYN